LSAVIKKAKPNDLRETRQLVKKSKYLGKFDEIKSLNRESTKE